MKKLGFWSLRIQVLRFRSLSVMVVWRVDSGSMEEPFFSLLPFGFALLGYLEACLQVGEYGPAQCGWCVLLSFLRLKSFSC